MHALTSVHLAQSIFTWEPWKRKKGRELYRKEPVIAHHKTTTKGQLAFSRMRRREKTWRHQREETLLVFTSHGGSCAIWKIIVIDVVSKTLEFSESKSWKQRWNSIMCWSENIIWRYHHLESQKKGCLQEMTFYHLILDLVTLGLDPRICTSKMSSQRHWGRWPSTTLLWRTKAELNLWGMARE